MEAFTYKGITDGKYVEGDIEALNIDDASFLLKEKKIIITNIFKSKKKKADGKKKKSSFSLFSGKKKVKVEDIVESDGIFTILMGDNVEPRRDFIVENALRVKNLDV